VTAPQPQPAGIAAARGGFAATSPVATTAAGSGIATTLTAIAVSRTAVAAVRPTERPDGSTALAQFLDALAPLMARTPTSHQREVLAAALADVIDARFQSGGRGV
jgi:hypothetical protein